MKRHISILLLLIFILSALSLNVSSGGNFTAEEDRIVVVLDPGHGFFTYGNWGEAEYNMYTAKKMKEELDKDPGFICYLTYDDNTTYPTHYERALFADSVNADIMISVHFNSTSDPERRGVEAWSSVIDKYDLGDLAETFCLVAQEEVPSLPISGAYKRRDTYDYYWDENYQWDVKGDSSSGVLSDYYGIITWGLKFGIPTFIIEEMYLSNEEDVKIASNLDNIDKIAVAQAHALIDYFDNHTHEYSSEMTVDAPLSCIYRGKESRHCTLCYHRKDARYLADEPDPHKHFMKEISSAEPTCEKEGYTGWYCVYAQSMRDQAEIEDFELHEEKTPVPATGHNYVMIDALAATEYTAGHATYRCDKCYKSYTIEFSQGEYDCQKEGHILFPDESKENIESECAKNGYEYYFCLACGEDITKVIPAKGHRFVTLSETKESCAAPGQKTVECTVCGYKLNVYIPADPHEFVIGDTKEADCETDGYIKYVCHKCGAEGKTETIEKKGHVFGEYVMTKAPSMFFEGHEEKKCVNCGYTEERTIEKNATVQDILIYFVYPALLLGLVALLVIMKVNENKRKKETAKETEQEEEKETEE